MKRSPLTVAQCTFVLSGAAHAFATREPQETRVVRGTVLGLDGRPAAGRIVHLVGLSRVIMKPVDPKAQPDGLWRFKSDSNGHFVARIESRGEYVLVVDRTDADAGAVSSRFTNDKNVSRPVDKSDEWGVPVPLRPTGLDLVLKVPGLTLQGRIVDYSNPEIPLAGAQVVVHCDLHMKSHTGYGAEIFEQTTTSGANGHFTLRHIYPARFDIRLADVFWLKTKFDGEWQPDVIDSLTPEVGQDEMRMEIMASEKPLFRHSGKVTDAAGSPIAGAEVTFGMSHHREVQTWADSHSCSPPHGCAEWTPKRTDSRD
jgi:hypothetical protein